MLMLALAPLLLSPAPLAPLSAEEVLLLLADGTEVTGTTSTKSVELETEFGSIIVETGHVATIEFGDVDAITTRGGLTFEGDVSTKTIKLNVAGKKRNVKTARIERWISVVDGKRLDAADVAGEWMTTFGPMTLEQIGVRVTGHYGYDETSLTGTVSGEEFTIEYGSGGRATFELWDDGLHMAGPWENGQRDGQWGAYRLKAKAAVPRPGEIVRGQTESGLWYHLRVPKEYDGKSELDAICILHGSNMTAADYVGTIAGAWPDLAERYVIVGFDGEQMNGWSEEGSPTYNYTYINFSGDGVGPAFANRQSPARIAEGLEQLRAELNLGRWFVGGHSQGAWCTYPVAMFYPDLVAGAFPVSGGMLIQCEPTSFDDEDLMARQRAIPFAPVHGTNDEVVAFSSGQSGFDSLIDGEFPAARFFTDDRAAHMFARLPVDDAIRWLDEMSSGDAARLAKLGEAAVKDKRWRDVGAALRYARGAAPEGAIEERLGKIAASIDHAAEKALDPLRDAILMNRDGGWVDEFLEARAHFQDAPAAAPLMDAYRALREEHQGPADDLFWKQRSEQDKDVQREMREELVETYYASSWYALVKGWLD